MSEDQQLSDLAYYSKRLSKRFNDRASKMKRRERLDPQDGLQIIHKILQWMVTHGQ